MVDQYNVTDRIVIEGIRPSTPSGYPAKAVVGRPVRITPTSSATGTTSWPPASAGGAATAPRASGRRRPCAPLGNDRFEAVIEPTELGAHEFVVEGWTDRLATWRHEVTVKLAAGQAVELELEEGARLLEEAAERVPRVDRARVTTAIDSLRNTQAPAESRLSGALDPALVALLDELPDPADLAASEPHAAVGRPGARPRRRLVRAVPPLLRRA